MRKCLFLLLVAVFVNFRDNILNQYVEKDGRIEEVNDNSEYTFQDPVIKKTIEEYFEKNANEFTKDDYKKLSQFEYFVVRESVNTLVDVEVLFPNIKYLSTSIDELSINEYNRLKNFKSLKALTIYCNTITASDFENNLEYFEIAYADYENLPKENRIANFSVDENNLGESHLKGNIQKLVRIHDGNSVYELISTDQYYGDEFDSEQERKVFVYERDTLICKSVLEATAITGNYADNRLQLADVNFDGKTDILIDNGHFGAQGLVRYMCLINNKKGFIECDSFTEIANPSIDKKNKKILSTWRNSAASHSWAMYVFKNNKFIMSDCLTESLLQDSTKDEDDVWEYTIESLKGNKLQIKDKFTGKDYSDKEIDEMIYTENSFWGLSSDRWNTLYNQGKMVGFSIYGESYINETIRKIIDN